MEVFIYSTLAFKEWITDWYWNTYTIDNFIFISL